MNKFIKYLLYIIIAIALLGTMAWFAFLNVPKASSQGKTADFQLPATELYQAFEADEEASNAKYISKIIDVTGTIEEISTDEQGAAVVLLAGGDFGGVLCTLEKSQSEKIKAKKLGDTITIKGVCTGMLMEVVLNKGVIGSKFKIHVP